MPSNLGLYIWAEQPQVDQVPGPYPDAGIRHLDVHDDLLERRRRRRIPVLGGLDRVVRAQPRHGQTCVLRRIAAVHGLAWVGRVHEPRRDFDAATRRGELAGIAREVGYNLPQAHLVADD